MVPMAIRSIESNSLSAFLSNGGISMQSVSIWPIKRLDDSQSLVFWEAVLMETRFGSVNVNVEINVLLTVNDFKKDSLAVVGVCDQK